MTGASVQELQSSHTGHIFLTAEWRNLLMLNYSVSRELLERYVPKGTELDSFDGRFFVSLVGFQFLSTRLAGRFSIPFHTTFDEVNLRFYVRRRDSGEDRRGVVFIKEIVPRFAIARIARYLYGEKYSALPMRREIRLTDSGARVSYGWKLRGAWCAISAESSGAWKLPAEGSFEQFITEHYWGYAAQESAECVEYRVAHPSWRVRRAKVGRLEGNVPELYGDDFARLLAHPPKSAFIAEGSPVTVFSGRRIL